mgnify:CR=1 FL=1
MDGPCSLALMIYISCPSVTCQGWSTYKESLMFYVCPLFSRSHHRHFIRLPSYNRAAGSVTLAILWPLPVAITLWHLSLFGVCVAGIVAISVRPVWLAVSVSVIAVSISLALSFAMYVCPAPPLSSYVVIVRRLSIWPCPVITVSICCCRRPCQPYPANLQSAVCFGRGPSLGRFVQSSSWLCCRFGR